MVCGYLLPLSEHNYVNVARRKDCEKTVDIGSVLLLSISLAMDAFAVSLGNGMALCKLRVWDALKTGLFFGGFQMLMPILGWLAGRTIASYIQWLDHWLAFGLLSFIGGKMLWDGLQEKDVCEIEQGDKNHPTATRRLLMMALATSIDALAVGVGLALLETPIVQTAGIIGAVTFVLCVCGVALGKKLGGLFRKRALIAGGVMIIGIGLKVFIEHLVNGI